MIDDLRTLLAPAWEQVSTGLAGAAAALPPGTAPLWVQALGTVLAILWATGAARRQTGAALALARQAEAAREEAEIAREEAQAARGRAFAAFLIPHMQQIGHLSDRHLKRGPDGQAAFKDTAPALLLLPEMPQGVNFIDNVALLPDGLRRPVIDLYARVALHNADLDAYARTWTEPVNRRYFETVLEARWRQIAEAQGAVLDALAQILQDDDGAGGEAAA
ncbi:MAG TPA: hypothetical protein VHL98_06675 [Microvirga sp.]|jgi:hypothetical protein|nr:hypothetical protein [Microvirga sp.]